MTNIDQGPNDEGGESPCFAHLLDIINQVPDQLLARLVTELADAVVIADHDGTIAFWNDAATRLFGFNTTDAIGQTLDLIIPERLRERHWAGYREVMATGHTNYANRLLEVPAMHATGRRLSVAFTVTLLRGADGQPRAIAAVLRDETQRFEERNQMREEIARLQAASSQVE